MNIIPLDITNGLIDHEIGAGEYVKLLSAPTAANVTIKANRSFGNGIPLKVGHSVRARKEVRNVYISCDALAGETIKIMQADNNDDFDLDTPPSSVDVDLIGGYEQIALNQLGKMFEPYDVPILTSYVTASDLEITLLNKVLTADKIKLDLTTDYLLAGEKAQITVTIDGAIVARMWNISDVGFVGHHGSSSELVELDGVTGKTINISADHTSTGGRAAFVVLQEYELKA